MDDLLVIILTLVFAAIGIFGQMKKKQAANQRGPQPEPQPESELDEPESFWDFLDPESQRNTMQQAPVQVMEEQKQPVETVADKPAPKKAEYQFEPENEGASIYAHDLTSDKNKEQEEKKTPKDRFSLKKAVIYSEILNRKYT